MIINYEETDKNVFKYLSKNKIPIHYKDAHNKCAVYGNGYNYSRKTDPIEKFRQYYGERNNGDKKGIVFIKGGYLGLSHWFPPLAGEVAQLSVIPRFEVVPINMNYLVSYDAGYDTGKRSGYYYDHYGDSNTTNRYLVRRRGAIVESHIRHYFRENYPLFFREASNHGRYKDKAIDDFSLVTSFHNIIVDTKSISYKDKLGYNVNVVRNSNTNTKIIYISGEIDDNRNQVIIKGIAQSSWVKVIGVPGRNTYHISENYLYSIDVLLVLLNMAEINLDYNMFYYNVKR